MIWIQRTGLSKFTKLLTVVVFLSVLALSLTLNIQESQVTFSGPLDTDVNGAFTLENLGNITIANISFVVSQTLSNGAETIPDANVLVNNGNDITLGPNSNSNIPVTVSIPGNIPADNYFGILRAFSDSEETFVALVVQAQSADNTPPEVISFSPTGVISQNNVVFSVNTNEAATCKYSHQPGDLYENMGATFTLTSGTVHEQALELDNGGHNFYVRCKDVFGNAAVDDYHASFTINTLPTAEIRLSDPSPVNAGIITVYLELSEDVKGEPTLKYELTGGPSVLKRDISLEGSGRDWKGYMIVEEKAGTLLGNFIFSAIAHNGQETTEISKGELFIIDTEEPGQVANFEIVSTEGGHIELQWHFAENDTSYNIYRDIIPDVDYTDLYENTEKNTFVDRDIVGGVTYYYRVAAVDAAGNIGKTSIELSSTGLFGKPTGELAAEFMGDVDKVIASINDLEKTATDIEQNLNDEQFEIFDILGLQQLLTTKRNELNTMKQRVNDFKKQALTKEELDKKIKREELTLKRIRQEMPESLDITGSIEFGQSLSEETLIDVIELLYGGYEDRAKEKLLKKNRDLYDKLSVKGKARTAQIIYLDGREETRTLIQKEVLVDEDVKDFSVIEYIPKGVIGTTEDITFHNENYVVLNEDPVIEWKENDIVYSTEQIIDINKYKETRILLLQKEEQTFIQEEKKSFTGLSILTPLTGGIGGILVSLLVLGGLLAYYFFGIKEVKLQIFNGKLARMINKTHGHLDNKQLGKAKEGYRNIREQYRYTAKEKRQQHTTGIIELADRINGLEFKYHHQQLQKFITQNDEKNIARSYHKLQTTYDNLPKTAQSFFYQDIETMANIIREKNYENND